MSSNSLQLHFVQRLRVILISFVVAHHAGQPYGPTGGEWPVSDPASSEFLGAFFALNASFGMGFFFLLAGYFVEGSYNRRGPGAFVRSRLLRLGIPLVFVTLFVFGAAVYSDSETTASYLEFLFFEYIGHWRIEMGHLWFIAQLLLYSLIYTLWRILSLKVNETKSVTYLLPGHRAIFIYAVALGIIGGAVRIYYPQDDWVLILWLIPAEPAHLPQYISLFVIGIVASKGNWIVEFDPTIGYRWLLAGITAFIVGLVIMARPQVLPDFYNLSIIWGGLEAFVCVGFILGFLAIGRTYFAKPGAWWGYLDRYVYSVYLVHIFILIGIQMAIIEFDYPALAKFAFVTATGLIGSFAIVALLRRFPLARRLV